MDATRPPVLVIPGRERYHEVTLNVWAAVMGIVYLIGAPPPNSLSAVLPDAWRYVWAAGFAVAGGLALAGSYWLSDVERGLELERAGLVMLTGSLVIYVTGVFVFAGWVGLMGGGLAAAWAWANIRRSVAITRDLHHIRANREARDGQ